MPPEPTSLGVKLPLAKIVETAPAAKRVNSQTLYATLPLAPMKARTKHAPAAGNPARSCNSQTKLMVTGSARFHIKSPKKPQTQTGGQSTCQCVKLANDLEHLCANASITIVNLV